MNLLTRVVHVLAVGLWFGSAVFFTFLVTPTLFRTLESQAAGTAVGPIFPQYFSLQGACGVLAAGTALAWAARGGIHRMRLYLLAVALVLVLTGWLVALRVEALRPDRHAGIEAARAAFGTWHTVSLLLNMAVIGLVTVAAVLASLLPDRSLPAKDASALRR